MITLFNIVNHLLETLKSIFVPHCAYIFDSTIEVLKDVANKKSEPNSLWIATLKVLFNCFLHNSDGFINEHRFNAVMQPLVSQILILERDPSVKESVYKYVIPAISQLAVAGGSDALWKPLNTSLMMKSRSSNAEVRMICLRVLQDMYMKLGEELLGLLPETIPFLAELMEDDEHEVEKLCHEVCNLIQQYLGEDIQQYFNA